jgi:enoyl-CoA hydratase/carnithine racemase
VNHVLVRQEEGVWEITLNRPQVRNALSSPMAQELREAVEEAGQKARAVVLTGAGSAFCAGADLKERAGLDAVQSREHNRRLYHAIEAVARCPVPVVAALNGPAMGGGLELALAADVRLADPTARMALPEVTLGILPGAGGTQRLLGAVPRGWARAMLLLGVAVDASQALAMGLVQGVSEPGQVREMAWAWARRAAAAAPLAVRAVKELLLAREEAPLAQGLLLEREMLFRLFQTHDRDEGLQAFAQGRPPRYEGR